MISINKNKCIGCGACAAVCPDVFEIIDNKAVVKTGQKNCKSSCVKEAADNCPVNAIKI